jgi:putative ABC transport system substrate-binding protein
VIIAIAGDSLQAAATATRTVPIVVFGSDPVGMDLAASHARPGGNVTGVVILTAELDAKRLDLLREAAPQARRIAVLLQRHTATRPASERELRRVAASAGVELLVQDAATAEDYAGAFAAMRAAGAQALLIGAHAQFNGDRDRLAALALAAGLPTACEWAVMARAGCLIGYGPDQDDLRRRMARYVAAILGGAQPGELPIETPTRFEFAVNLRTARALGITVPPAIMIQADEVIE